MSKGGFTAFVKCTRTRLSGGLSGAPVNKGEPYVDANIDFEGRLAVFDYGSLSNESDRATQPNAHVEIEFAEKQETENTVSSDETKYIGTIQLFERLDEGGSNPIAENATVRIFLPLSMFPTLYAMKGDLIKFETIHDLISEPNKRQKRNCIVALVQSVYFEVQFDKGNEKPKKQFSISFG